MGIINFQSIFDPAMFTKFAVASLAGFAAAQDMSVMEHLNNAQATENKDDPNWYSRHHTVTTVHHPDYHPYWADNAEKKPEANEEDPNWYSRHHTVTTVHHPDHHYWYDNAEKKPEANEKEDNWYSRHHTVTTVHHPDY